MMRKLLLILLFILAMSAQAGQVVKAFIDHQDEHYLVHLVMQVEAPQAKIYQLITDFAHLDRLSDSIRFSQILEQDKSSLPPATRKYTQVKLVSEGCVLFICQTVTQVQNVYELDQSYITVDVEPALSNVKSNNQFWYIEAINANTTRIHYSADIVPDFWIPPIIGSWIFQARLLEEAKTIINNAEKLANPGLTTRYTVVHEDSQSQPIVVDDTDQNIDPNIKIDE
ncbi:hypothetical protein JYT31_01425 [Beggiatoa alba]|nr:hypothetical protein [Beggiatoa alba]